MISLDGAGSFLDDLQSCNFYHFASWFSVGNWCIDDMYYFSLALLRLTCPIVGINDTPGVDYGQCMHCIAENDLIYRFSEELLSSKCEHDDGFLNDSASISDQRSCC